MARARVHAPPEVPPAFWETKEMQAALRSRHMGRVVRAYRRHLFHGRRGLSQDDVGAWALMNQAQMSRLENGPPPQRLDQLIFWARLLRIPQRYLWFALPGEPEPAGFVRSDEARFRQLVSRSGATLEDLQRLHHELGEKLDELLEGGRGPSPL